MTTIILLLALTADPWAVPSVQWQPLPVVESSPAEPTWVIWKGDNSDPYKDVHSRLSGLYKDVHEATHQTNNYLNNKWGFYGKKRYAIYCLQGRIVALHEPPIRLAEVAAAVPSVDRGAGYQTYLINQQRYWNDNPLYVLDEWCSYSNEHDWDHTDIGLRYSVEFSRYAAVLLTLAERCPNYDATSLRTFIHWHTARVDAQVKAAKSKPAAVSFGRTTGACANGRCP